MLRIVAISFLLMALGAAHIEYEAFDNISISDDTFFLVLVQEKLDEYRYTENYDWDNFNCLDSSLIAVHVLEKYHPALMLSPLGTPGNQHAWIGIPDPRGGWALIETTKGMNKTLGWVVDPGYEQKFTSGIIILDPLEFAKDSDYGIDRYLNNINNFVLN